MLCVYFTKVKKESANYDTGFYLFYKNILAGLIRYRWLTVLGCVGMLFIAIQGMQYVPKLFFPPSDRDYFKVELELPIGTRITATESVVRDVESFIANNLKVNEQTEQGVTDWVSYIGNGGPRFLLTHSPEPTSSNYALMIITTTSYKQIDNVMKQIEDYALARHPDLLLKLRKIENGAPIACLLYTSPSPRDRQKSRMPSSA